MSYKHGVSTREGSTSIVAPVNSTAGLPVVVGTAPINLGDLDAVNKPVLAYTYSEAVKKLGYSDDFKKYTLCEFVSSHFSLFNVAPVIFINVLNPQIHNTEETTTISVKDKEAILNVEGVLKETVVIKNGAEEYKKENYDTQFDDDGMLHIHLDEDMSEIEVQFKKIDPSMVNTSDVVGGVTIDGAYKGLELVNHVFPKFRLVPGMILAPKFSTDPVVQAVMAAKTTNINGVFQADSLVDISTENVKNYSEVAERKNLDNVASPKQIVFWPKVALGKRQYHLSTQAAGVICTTDARENGVPYKSPSNKNLQADSAVLEDGSEVVLGQDHAAYLNGQGVVTALNFIGGWKLWGNRTAAYPGNSDPKDSFIPIRRMFNWIRNSLILTYWQKVDDPMNKKLIETVVDSENIKLNALAARGQILGGRVVFLEEDNPLTSLIDGKVSFRVYLTPPSPAREIDFLVEFDTEYLGRLFD